MPVVGGEKYNCIALVDVKGLRTAGLRKLVVRVVALGGLVVA
jgi:hypothetical protein